MKYRLKGWRDRDALEEHERELQEEQKQIKEKAKELKLNEYTRDALECLAAGLSIRFDIAEEELGRAHTLISSLTKDIFKTYIKTDKGLVARRIERTIKERASAAGYAKAIKDPKRAEKKIVKECWEAWQTKPKQYKNKTAFASAMIDKFRPDDPEEESKHLSSVKKITEWCTKWEREKNSTLLAGLAPS